MARNPLALGARLEQHHGRRERPQDGRETLPPGVDPLLRGGPVGGEDAELRLAFVQIQAYRYPLAAGLRRVATLIACDALASCGAKDRYHVSRRSSRRFIPTNSSVSSQHGFM